MKICKFCHSAHLWKHGIKDGSQKWICTKCRHPQCEVDWRFKFTDEKKKIAIQIYLEGVGLRGTARILSLVFKKTFCAQSVMEWVAQAEMEIEEREKRNWNF